MGLALSMSFGLVAVVVVPWPRAIGLLTGFIGGFIVLAGVQTWFYCDPSLKKVLRWSVPALAIMAALDAWALWGAQG